MKIPKAEPLDLTRLLNDYEDGKIKTFNVHNDLNPIYGENPHIDLKTNIGSYKLYGQNWQDPDPDGVMKHSKDLGHSDFGFGGGSGGFSGGGSGGGY